MQKFQLHPYTRLIFLIAGITGTILCENTLYLLFFWLVILIPVLTINKNIKTHLNFLLVAMLPMLVMLTLSHWIIFKNWSHFELVLNTVLKVIVYTSIIHIALIIPQEHVLATFKMWKMKNEILITTLGSYIVWVDIANRADKIITARFSRGYITKRTFWAKLKQFPHLLIPLIIGIMRTASERAYSWEQKRIIQRLDVMNATKIEVSTLFNFFISILIVLWFGYNLVLKFI